MIFTLPDGQGRVFVREVYSENIIELRAAGKKRAELLNEVIRNMDDINRDSKYENLQVEKGVPCPCAECAQAETPFFHKYDTLEKRIERRKRSSLCEPSGDDIAIDEIFGASGVRRPDARTAKLSIFLSYAHAQRDYFPIFKNDFCQYAKLPGLDIDVFDDTCIPPGAAWDELLQRKVAETDVMVLLVSQEFINSDYIKEKEFGAAMERLKDGSRLLIVPIYFAPCAFNSEADLASLQFFKPHGEDFNKAQKGNEFSYIDLIKFRENDGQPIPNSNRQHYMKALMGKLEPLLRNLAEGY